MRSAPRVDSWGVRGRAHRRVLESRLETAQQRIAALEAELALRSQRDPLTGLPNIGEFRTRLESEVHRARRYGRPLTVALLDLDGFRELNAHHGHAAGDSLLATAGQVISQSVRVNDSVCRTGADEFAVLLPETDTASATHCFERVFAGLESIEIESIRSASASVGIGAYERRQSYEPKQTAEELFTSAGKALDRARAAGGGRAVVAGAPSGLEEVEDPSHRDAVVGLAVTLLERDRYTGEHSDSVVEMSDAVARRLGLPDHEVDRVRMAAQLHDIGKVGIPDEILNKPGGLDEDQWIMMREHPVIGERILRAIPGLGSVARIVRHEHESFDGSGYPDGLSGNDIPIGSRIILTCDAFHAMTSDRPYRKAMPDEDALNELMDNAGGQFDPQVVEVLVGYMYSRRGQLSAANTA